MLRVCAQQRCHVCWAEGALPCSVGGWAMGARPHWEVTHLRRAVAGNSVPLPRALLRLVLALVVPKLLTRLLLTMLPPELGSYLTSADQTVYLAGACPWPLHLAGLVGTACKAQPAAMS